MPDLYITIITRLRRELTSVQERVSVSTNDYIDSFHLLCNLLVKDVAAMAEDKYLVDVLCS